MEAVSEEVVVEKEERWEFDHCCCCRCCVGGQPSWSLAAAKTKEIQLLVVSLEWAEKQENEVMVVAAARHDEEMKANVGAIEMKKGSELWLTRWPTERRHRRGGTWS